MVTQASQQSDPSYVMTGYGQSNVMVTQASQQGTNLDTTDHRQSLAMVTQASQQTHLSHDMIG